MPGPLTNSTAGLVSQTIGITPSSDGDTDEERRRKAMERARQTGQQGPGLVSGMLGSGG